jgi:hypothetical protein
MTIRFIIARHEPQGYSLQITGYEALLPTIATPQIADGSQGIFASEASCAAYLRATVGVTPDEIQRSLGELASGIVTPHSYLELTMAQARRVLEQGYPT